MVWGWGIKSSDVACNVFTRILVERNNLIPKGHIEVVLPFYI
jgi:hypothetical protein